MKKAPTGIFLLTTRPSQPQTLGVGGTPPCPKIVALHPPLPLCHTLIISKGLTMTALELPAAIPAHKCVPNELVSLGT